MPPPKKGKPTAPAAANLLPDELSRLRVSEPQAPIAPLDAPPPEAKPQERQLSPPVVAQGTQKRDEAGAPKKDLKSVTVGVDESGSDHTDHGKEDEMVLREKRPSSPGAQPAATVIPPGAPPLFRPFQPRCSAPLVPLDLPSSERIPILYLESEAIVDPRAWDVYPHEWLTDRGTTLDEEPVPELGPKLPWSLWRRPDGAAVRVLWRPH